MHALALHQTPDAAALVRAFLAGRTPTTLRAYAGDLSDFAAYLDVRDVNAAAARLLGKGHGPANALALGYRARMVERGLSAATVNRRLAALRSLVKLGRVLGMVPWQLEVPNAKVRAYRDTRGCGRDGFVAMLRSLQGRIDSKSVRDRALLRLMFERGLRRCELTRLNVDDVDVKACTLAVLGKGRTAREALTIAPATMAAVREWLDVRGDESGPLFVNLDRGHERQRLSGSAIYDVVRAIGEAVGVKARPHGLRHSGVTHALDLGIDVRSVQRWSRHADLRVLMTYDDNRSDLGGAVACALADATV